MNFDVVEFRYLEQSDFDEDIVRELLSYDMLCKESVQFVFIPEIAFKFTPSAMHWSRKYEWPWALKAVPVESEHNYLEAGGGHAIFKCGLARKMEGLRLGTGKVHVADINKESLAMLKNRPFNKWGFVPCEDDITCLGFEDGFFDAVYCLSVFEHMPNYEKAFNELLRVTKPGGHVVITCDVQIMMEIGYRGDPKNCPNWTPDHLGLKMAELCGKQLPSAMPSAVGQIHGCFYTVLCILLRKK